MSSDLPTVNDQISSYANLNELYSPSLSSLSPSNRINSESLTASLTSNSRKDSTLKLPYPVLSDHRDPSSILLLLQKETQTTSKKITNVIKQIEECERRLTLNHHKSENEKKTFKYERVKLKQQLDALKKHERRVSLQIDFITTKTEIKGLEDEHKQIYENTNSDESQQIKILLGKLKQKLDKMKIYMRTRNEQMKKLSNEKQRVNKINDHRKLSQSSSQQQQRLNSSSTKDSNRKRPSTSINNSLSNKRLKPMIHLSSRMTSHDAIQPPIVRFVNKTTDSTINSASPTTPASSSSTSSPPLLIHNGHASIDDDDDDDDELGLDLNIDELFDDDSYADQTVQRIKTGMNKNSSTTNF